MPRSEMDSFANNNSKQGWLPAYIDFLKDDTESRALKLLPLAVLGFGPLDEFIPVFGQLDDIPTLAVAAIGAVITAVKVNRHR